MRVAGIIVLIWLGVAAVIGLLLYVKPQPRNYNCLSLPDTSLQLNGHLDRNTPATIRPALFSLDKKAQISTYRIRPHAGEMITYLQAGDTSGYQDLLLSDGLPEIYWSPDSRYVAVYGITPRSQLHFRAPNQLRFADASGKIIKHIEQYYAYAVIGWSADSHYFAVWTRELSSNLPYVELYDAQNDFQRTVFPTPSGNGGIWNMVWSPVGHRLAYLYGTKVVFIEPETGSQAIVEPQQNLNFGTTSGLNWSPDGEFLALDYYQSFRTRLRLFDTHLNEIMYTDYEVSRAPQAASFYSRWSEDSQSFMYFKPTDRENRQNPAYQLWRFDLLTGESHLLAEAIRTFAFNDKVMALERIEGDTATVEIRQSDGSHPIPVRSYRADVFITCCTWLLKDRILISDGTYGYQLNLINQVGQVVWQPQEGQQVNGTSSFADESRFIGMSLLGEPSEIVIFDVESERAYSLPQEFNQYLPSDLLGSTTDWIMDALASPDDKVWLIYLASLDQNDGVFLSLEPDTETWTLLDQGISVDNMLWSPDSQRFSYFRTDVYLRIPTIIARSKNLQNHWNLGEVGRYRYEGMQWTKCGGALAAIRGD